LLNTSNGVIRSLLTGGFPGILSVSWGIVDVRDVATAHVAGMERPQASGRHLTAGYAHDMRELVGIIRSMKLGYKLPSLPLDGSVVTSMVRIAARFQEAGTRDFLLTNLGRRVASTTARSAMSWS
jgi:dihydroflavonol-4-reductase